MEMIVLRQIRIYIGRKKLPATKTTKGRKFKLDDDAYLYSLNPWLLDKIKILQSKGFRRLGKTQVHHQPDSHIRDRIFHTAEVVTVSTTIAHKLKQNIELCEAIAWGHDIGHGPYGHAFEEVTGINHALNSAIVLQELERKGAGLNLTREVVDGIISHSRNKKALVVDERKPNEVNIVVYADKIAYIFSDFNDFQRLGWLKDKDLPEEIFELGDGINAQRKRTETCINALVEESLKKGAVSFLDSEVAQKFNRVRDWMFQEMYLPIDRSYQKENLEIMIDYFKNKGNEFCGNLHPDFIVSLMTDKEADWFSETLRRREPIKEEIYRLSFMEIILTLNGKKIDHTKYDLW